MRYPQTFFLILIGLLMACSSPAEVPVPNAEAEQAEQSSPTPQPAVAEVEAEAEVEEDIEPEAVMDQLAKEYAYFKFSTVEVPDPIDFNDWPQSEPEDQGIDSAQLDKLGPHIEEQYGHIHSFVVMRNGVLVYEYYKDGRSKYSADILWSVTKSITSLLIGIAADDGLLELDQSLGELLPPEQLAESDPDLADITIHDLLTMTSGVACPGDRCHDASVPTMLGKDLNYETGERFLYDTGASHLLSAVIDQVTDMQIHEYAAEELFVPLGIEPPPWQIDTNGVPFGGKGLAMRPRDMARIGQLILNDGVWEGEQLVPADYLNTATQNQVADIHDEAYGYLFWIDEESAQRRVSAVGYGGQYITVIPEYDLVVVTTSDFSLAKYGQIELVEPFVIQAITE
ncbi:MAG: serine hydrolase domain-containing protein [Anaerolineae bacterium]